MNVIVSILLFLLALLLFVAYYFTKNNNYWKKKKVPYLKPTPFCGILKDLFLFKSNLGTILKDVYNSSDAPFVGTFLLNEPCLVLRDPEVLKTILVKDFQYFYDRYVGDNRKDDPVAAYMLFFLKNPEWKAIRYQLAPIFSTGKIRQTLPLIEEVAKELVLHITETLEEAPEVDAKLLLGKYSTDVISSCAFGINSNSLKHEDAEFGIISRMLFNYKDFYRGFCMCVFVMAPKLAKFFRLKFLNPVAGKFLREVFWRTMADRKNTQFVRNDLIDLLLKIIRDQEIKKPDVYLSDDVILSQAVQFFQAGFETTSTTVAFTLYEMALHQDIQNKLRDEIRTTIQKHGSCTADAIKDMTYLDMCIKETLRKYPPLPYLDRICNRNYKIPGTDTILEKGTAVMVPMLGLHYDPNYFPEPEIYNPERFSPENEKNIVPFSYIPFGDGSRNCIGARLGMMVAKIAIINILTNFRVQESKNTREKIKYDPLGVTLSPSKGIRIGFTKI